MPNTIAVERSFVPSIRRRPEPLHIVPRTDYLDLSYDAESRALWIYLSTRAPAFVSQDLIQDLLGVDNVMATSLATDIQTEASIDFKIIASKRQGVFSLGGDLASFRYHIDRGDRNALTQYARAALDAIWTNVTGSNIPGMTSLSLVQGEAQGGGFEAALSAHVLVAEKGAMFGFPEALFGMFPGMGGYALLSARTSSDTAKRLIGSTNRYSAEMLYEMGVVDVLAEAGEGRQALESWIGEATPGTTEKYRNRFAGLERRLLEDSIEEWVEQALCLSSRQLRTMGYILEAQKRASTNKTPATVTPVRRKIEFADISTSPLLTSVADGSTSPLLIAPESSMRYSEPERLAFLKRSRPWIYENLAQHGALVLREFAGTGVNGLNRFTAALRTNRGFKASQAVPTPANIHDNVFADDGWILEAPQALHNSYSDCILFPAHKILSYDKDSQNPSAIVTLANTRSLYENLDRELVLEFEKRGVLYKRIYPSSTRHNTAQKVSTHDNQTWEQVFKTTERTEVEMKCRNAGLNFAWQHDDSIEVWNRAPACTTHSESGERLWFNQVHAYRLMTSQVTEQKSLFSKIFGFSKPSLSLTTTFNDGGAICQAYLDEIEAVHQRSTLSLELSPGDVLLIDNARYAQGHHGFEKEQSCFFALY